MVHNTKPSVERRTLKDINTRSQTDYDHLSNAEVRADICAAQKTILNYLPRISHDVKIPYTRRNSYTPQEYADTLTTHVRMHWEYLEKRAQKALHA